MLSFSSKQAGAGTGNSRNSSRRIQLVQERGVGKQSRVTSRSRLQRPQHWTGHVDTNGTPIHLAKAARDGSSGSTTPSAEEAAKLAQRAATIAQKLIQQRDGPAGQTDSGAPLDKSLTSLLSSLLKTLADANTSPTSPTIGSAPRKTPSSTSTSDNLLQLLTQWADEFLVSSDGLPAGTAPRPSSASQTPPSSTADDAAAVAKSLFMQLLAELLPPDGGQSPPNTRVQPVAPAATPASGAPSVGRGLLAATAAAFTAREAANRLQQRFQGGASTRRESSKAAVSSRSTTDDFDPDTWEATARAAAEAAQAEEGGLDAVTAAAAVATNTNDFSPDAWEQAAAAAAAAAADAEDGDNMSSATLFGDRSAAKQPLPEPCWAVKTLAAALKAAAQAAMLHSQEGHVSPPEDASHHRLPSVQELLLLPAPAAAQELLQVAPADRAGLLLLLCGAGVPSEASLEGTGTPSAPGHAAVGFGSRGDAWLMLVLEGVASQLGLLEAGLLLAAVHDRYGPDVFLKAATTLLPLTDATEPSITLSSAAAPPPAAALQALLLHWLLQPQLAAAGLPMLQEATLLRLLPQVVAASSLRQLTQAAHWGQVWPLTKLQQAPDEAGNSNNNTPPSTASWQLAEPQLSVSLQSQAWCGLTGIPVVWVAHVAAAAASKLVHGTSSTSYSSSSHSGQLSEGAAAAANDARAVLTALLSGLQPSEPLGVLLMQEALLLPPDLAGLPASSHAAAQPWKQQLLQLLLEAYSGTGLPAASLADCIYRSLCCMWRVGSSGHSSIISMHEQQVLRAAAALLVALPAGRLQQELLALLANTMGTTSLPNTQHTAALTSMLAAAAEAADPAQAAAMLATLPMPFWADAWATFVSPVTGSFCWSQQQLAATLRELVVVARGSRTHAGTPSWQQLKAAWEVVAAHFNLQQVVQEVSSTGPLPFRFSKSYQFRPGVPFSGDGWDQEQTGGEEDDNTAAAAAAPRVACFSGSLGAFVTEVLGSASLPVAATHIAILVEVLPAQAFARLAAALVPQLVDAVDSLAPTAQGLNSADNSVSGAASAATTGGDLHRLAKSLLKLYGGFPELPEAPFALQLLATAAPHLALDRLPHLITATADLTPRLQEMPWVPGASSNSSGNSSGGDSAPELSGLQQLELVIAAAASGRDSIGLQHMLSMLVRQLPLKEAHVAFRVLQSLSNTSPHQQLTYEAIEKASTTLRLRCDAAAAAPAPAPAASAAGREDENVVWQMGQSDAASSTPRAARQALGSFVQDWGTAAAVNRSSLNANDSTVMPSGGAAGAAADDGDTGRHESDKVLLRQLSKLVADIPHAPPEGSWPMDAMHSPSYTAPLIKRCLALLVDWVPSCPSAAATAVQQVNILARKRRWTAAEASAVLQRLPLITALQLLLEAGSSGSSSKREVLVYLRPRLLRALVDWQGGEAVTQGLRELLVVGYNYHGVAGFVEVLADLRLAMSVGTSDNSSDQDAAAAAAAAAPNAYVEAVLTVLGVLLPTASATAPSATAAESATGHSWHQKLAQVLVQVSHQVPEAISARLAEQVTRSLADNQQKKPSVQAHSGAAAAWQADVVALLAALPAAADDVDDDVAPEAHTEWGLVAAAVTAAVAEAAGSTAVLQCIRATMQAVSTQASPAVRAAWRAEVPAVLGHLQQQGLHTCGVAAYGSLSGVSTGGDSSMEGRFGSRPGPITPSCISLQLLQLLHDLYQTDRAINLQQAAAAIVAVQASLGKALPLAVAHVLGGSLRGARGYGASGPDAAEVAAALESATAEAASRFQPTAAALPAATAAAAMQLSEALARCHELLPDELVASLMAALAAVLPWTDNAATTASAMNSSSSSSATSSGASCPAEVELAAAGWPGVTQMLLITSSLLTASCKVWGVDKGTLVAASLIQKLATPPVGDFGTAASPAAATAVARDPARQLRRSSSMGQLERSQRSTSGSNRSVKRSASTGSLKTEPTTATGATGSSSQASRAESALLRATASGRQGSVDQAGRAAANLRSAAGSGGVSSSSSSSQAGKATAALLKASDISSSQASRAEAKLLHAAVETGGQAAPGSHAGKAKAAMLQAAASGLSTPASSSSLRNDSAGGGGASSTASSTASQAQQAKSALVQALASGYSSSSSSSGETTSVYSSSVNDAELAAWGTDQLLSAADAWLWPGLSTPKELVQGILYPKYHSVGAAAAAAAGASARRPAGGANSETAAMMMLSPTEAAAALAAALPRLSSELPCRLMAEVLAQTRDLIPSATWDHCLARTAAAMAKEAGPAAAAGTEYTPGKLLELMKCTASGLQQQLEASRALPAAYAAVLRVAASSLPDQPDVQLLFQHMVLGSEATDDETGWGSSYQVQASTPEGFAQLLLELARPAGPVKKSSSSRLADAAASKQLSLVAAAAFAVFGTRGGTAAGGGTIISPEDVAAALAGHLYQADLLPRTYLTLVLLPHLTPSQKEVCVKQLGLTSTDAPAALAALADLCNTVTTAGSDSSDSNPGRQLSLAAYAGVLTTALEVTLAADLSRVGFPEARLGLELERQQTLQQLLAGVVRVLGTFRGMRQLHASPLGAQLLLPMHDLAAVLCYSWQLLPSSAATGLAAAVAAALERLQGDDKLTTVLQLLPNAAAEGFDKGAELWRPLLHVMAVAGGFSEAQEGSLTNKLLSVTSKQQQQGAAGQLTSHPLQFDAQATAASGGGQFADPAAVRAALAAAAANNDVGLSAGRLSRSTAAAAAAGGGQQWGAEDPSVSDDESNRCRSEVSSADAALVAAGVISILLVCAPMALLLGPMEALPVALGAAAGAIVGASQRRNKAAEAMDDSQDGDASSSSQPASPRTPTIADSTTTSSSSSSTARRAGGMGGRTKVTFAADDDARGPSAAASALNYGATAAAAAAAAAGGRGNTSAVSAAPAGLGSLAVDPDDVIKKIKGQSAHSPLDEALMEVVPLLLLPADSSSYTWPLQGLSAILYSKFPRLHAVMGGPGGSSLINMALAATLVNPDGPLAAVMHASELLTDTTSSSPSSTSSSGSSNDDLLAALTAAEAVHPHAVSMQLAERLLNALWAVLTGSGVIPADSSTSSSSGFGAVSAAAVSTPERAAATWQQIATALLAGVESSVAVQLLSGFAHRQQGNCEAQLRALAVAAALQQEEQEPEGGDSSKQQLLRELLVDVCASNKYPPLSFLTLLLHHTDVPLSTSETAAVLDTAFTQLTASYGIVLPQQQQSRQQSAYSSSNSSSVGNVGITGDFDSWGFDALTGTQALLGGIDADDAAAAAGLEGWGGVDSSSSGPQYRSTSSFFRSSNSSSGGGSNSRSSSSSSRVKLSSLPSSLITLVQSLVDAACTRRGHAAQALCFITEVLQVTHRRTPALEQRLSQGVSPPAAAAADKVLVVEEDQEQQLLQLAVTAVEGCMQQSGVSTTELETVLLDLLHVLSDRACLDGSNKVVVVVSEALAQQYVVDSSSKASSSITAVADSPAVSAELVGKVLTCAAEGVRMSEGVLSAARPCGSLFLACAADALFANTQLSVQQCLVLLSAVAAHMPERLGLQVVAAAAGRLHSVMPQAVAIVRQVALKD